MQTQHACSTCVCLSVYMYLLVSLSSLSLSLACPRVVCVRMLWVRAHPCSALVEACPRLRYQDGSRAFLGWNQKEVKKIGRNDNYKNGKRHPPASAERCETCVMLMGPRYVLWEARWCSRGTLQQAVTKAATWLAYRFFSSHFMKPHD